MSLIKQLKILDLVLELQQQIHLSLEKFTARYGGLLQIANCCFKQKQNGWTKLSQRNWRQIEELLHFLRKRRQILSNQILKE
ncbi:hypothetical protein BV378_08915 [Nostoc sp. RF31YmG]|nr:hypothetical protein BV378_08915 [Nostoc sp. RF31YmG]